MNYQSKEKKSQMKTIYITLAISLVIMAILVVLSGAWRRGEQEVSVLSTTEAMAQENDRQVMANRADEAEETTIETTDAIAITEVIPEEPVVVETLPEFISPTAGYIMKEHSGDTPVFSVTMNDYRPHVGVDVYAPAGDDVFASADGEISNIWEDPMSGNCISITHSGGAVSIYRNMSPTVPENITVGAKVSAGEVIGSVGESSLLEIADDPHVHFELTIDGAAVDPANYITFDVADTEYEG